MLFRSPAVVGAQETRAPVDDTRWETPPGEAADQQGPTADPLSYTVREEALV